MPRFNSGFLPSAHLILRVCVACAGPCTGSHAETLPEALTAARDFNPRIESARARSLASDEGVAQAWAGALPKLSASGDLGSRMDARNPALMANGSGRAGGYDVTLVQPLFDGGRTLGAVGTAKANSHAEREGVRAVVQQVMLAAATAYMDVRQDRNIVRLNEENAALLAKTAHAVHRSAAVQEATAADVSQADAAVANAQAQLELAKANLSGSEAAFEEATTHRPESLARAPAVDGLLPASRDEAIALAQKESPNIIQAVFKQDAARHSIEEARAQLLPTVSLQAGYQRRFDTPAGLGESDGLVAKVAVTVPLFSGGALEAGIRQAGHTHSASTFQRADVMAQTRTGVSQTWARMVSARAAMKAVTVQMEANRKALASIRQEQRLGQRSVFDVLSAQQAMLAAQIAREQHARNLAVAGFSLLALAGRLDPAMIESAASKGPNARHAY